MAKTNIWIDDSLAKKSLKSLKEEVKKLGEQFNKLDDPLKKAELSKAIDEKKGKIKEFENYLKPAANSIVVVRKEVNELAKTLNRLDPTDPRHAHFKKQYDEKTKQLKSLTESVKGVNQSYTGLRGVLNQATQGVGVFGKMLSLPIPVLGAIGAGVTGVVSGIGSWISSNRELEKSLSTLRSLTSASADDLKFYKEQAVEMSEAFGVSATDVVESFKTIGGNKAELLSNKQALAEVTESVIIFAQAAEIDLTEAAESVTGVMNQFNISTKESERIINAMAAGSNVGAAEISHLKESIEASGSVLNGYNVSLEQSIATLEVMAERNLKGAEAGTQLRNVMLTMQSIEALPEKAQKALEKYGVDTKIVADETLDFQVRLKEMSKISGDATAMVQVFGKENIVAGKAVLENVDKIGQFTEEVTGTAAAIEMQASNLDNLDGDLSKLGSTWDSLLLTIGDTGSVLRPVVQFFTSVIGWIKDTVTAFQNFDLTHIGDQFKKLALSIPLVGDAIDWLTDGMASFSVEFNEMVRGMTDTVTKELQTQGNAYYSLIEGIKANNEALKDVTLTEEEHKRVMDENNELINAIKNSYPELTAEIDLNKASTKELTELNHKINQSIIERALANAQAIETERIMGEMIKNTIEISQLAAKIKEGTATTTEILSADDLEKEKQNLVRSLESLPKAMEDVKKTVSKIDLGIGVPLKVATDQIKQAEIQLKKLQYLYKTSDDNDIKRRAKAEIQAQKQIISSNKQKIEEEKKASLEIAKLNDQRSQAEIDKEKETDETVAELAAKAANKATERAKQRANEAKQALEKLRNELEKLLDDLAKKQADFSYTKQLELYEDGLDKELFALQHNLSEKYDAEIEHLRKLSKEKGEVGAQAAEALKEMELLKAEELAYETEKIQSEFRKKMAIAEEEAAKKLSEEKLKWTKSLEQSIADLKVAEAIIGQNRVKDATLAEMKKAEQEFIKAREAQLIQQRDAELESLKKQFEESTMFYEDYENRRKLITEKYQGEIEQTVIDSTKRMQDVEQQRAEQILNGIQTAVNTINNIMSAMSSIQQKDLDNQHNREISRLDEQLEKKLITDEEYNLRKQEIDASNAEKKKEIQRDEAERAKGIALFEAIIGTALGVVKAIPNPIMMTIAAVTGAINTALIAAQPVPQFFDGGFTSNRSLRGKHRRQLKQYADGGFHDVIGAQDNRHYRAKYLGRHKGGMLPSSPSLVLASEHGAEYFVPNHLFKDARVANYVGMIEAIRTNQMAEGGFTMPPSPSGQDEIMAALLALIAKNTQVLSMLNSKMDNLTVTVGDKQIDDIQIRAAELNRLRS